EIFENKGQFNYLQDALTGKILFVSNAGEYFCLVSDSGIQFIKNSVKIEKEDKPEKEEHLILTEKLIAVFKNCALAKENVQPMSRSDHYTTFSNFKGTALANEMQYGYTGLSFFKDSSLILQLKKDPLFDNLFLALSKSVSVEWFYKADEEKNPVKISEQQLSALLKNFRLEETPDDLTDHNSTAKISGNNSVLSLNWSVATAFGSYSSAYEIDQDTAGNVFVYGSLSPPKLAKYNSNGVLQWIFNANFFGTDTATNVSSVFGDMAVDEGSSSIYLSEGWGFYGYAARTIQINASGIQTSKVISSGYLYEGWRILYDRCRGDSLIVFGQGVPNALTTIGTIDTAFTTFKTYNPTHTMQCCNDIVFASFDPDYRSFYFLHGAVQGWGQTGLSNSLVKVSLNSLQQNIFTVKTHHNFDEAANAKYILQRNVYCGGFNGIAVSSKYVYTYDGAVIKKWNKYSGSMIDSLIVSLLPWGQWAGLEVDECERIYVGINNKIAIYDSSYNLLSQVSLPDSVYDLKIYANKKIIACGKNFVFSQALTTTSFSTTANAYPSCANSTGWAEITPQCNPDWPYLFTSNNTSGFTIPLANLPVGTTNYTAFSKCLPVYSNSLVITQLPGSGTTSPINVNAVVQDYDCATGDSGSIATSVSGNNPPFQVSWYPPNQNLNNLLAGTYSVTVIDSLGCRLDSAIVIDLLHGPPDTLQIKKDGCEAYYYILYGPPGKNNYQWFLNGTLVQWETSDSLIVYGSAIQAYHLQWEENGCYFTAILPPQAGLLFSTQLNANSVNIFTPDHDGVNDEFILFQQTDLAVLKERIKNFSLKIYNRWGTLVFESTEISASWKGNENGNQYNDGVYYYIAEFELECDSPGKKTKYKGFIQLIR
ncbi:MAG: gliding motility-associated C-terminal domain-containing protein, partial [Bacteroidia bacterium]|nr:gliding motility-associated C-terminal domain-containing protein [Bacteroidia bacterium]